jgi:hypothetical protein
MPLRGDVSGDLVFGFDAPHKVGTVCGFPCEQCGPGVAVLIGIGKVRLPDTPLFIVAEATRQDWEGNVKKERRFARGRATHTALVLFRPRGLSYDTHLRGPRANPSSTARIQTQKRKSTVWTQKKCTPKRKSWTIERATPIMAIAEYAKALAPVLKDAGCEHSAKELERLLFEYDVALEECGVFMKDNLLAILTEIGKPSRPE